jgi:hypothetical protein
MDFEEISCFHCCNSNRGVLTPCSCNKCFICKDCWQFSTTLPIICSCEIVVYENKEYEYNKIQREITAYAIDVRRYVINHYSEVCAVPNRLADLLISFVKIVSAFSPLSCVTKCIENIRLALYEDQHLYISELLSQQFALMGNDFIFFVHEKAIILIKSLGNWTNREGIYRFQGDEKDIRIISSIVQTS